MKTDWSAEGVLQRRERYYAATQRKFVPYNEPFIPKKGLGQYLWDEKGEKFLDMLGMNLCISAGHTHPKIIQAVSEQMAQLQHCTTMFSHPTPAHYAEELVATMPKGEDWVVHFTNSGAEAIDLALMLARNFTGNTDILSLNNSYHGATFGAQSVTGIAAFRHRVQHLGGIHFVPEPNQYRGVFGAGTQPYLDAIDTAISTSTTGSLAGMIIEPVQGYGGIIEMPEGYIKGAGERVRAADGVLIIDEVQSGVGRTGKAFWAFESHDVIPDIVVMAKGIGNGFPIGAVVAKKIIAESMADKFLFHTYGANPVSTAAGRAVLQVLKEERLQENAQIHGTLLKDRLSELKQKYPAIGDVRGSGLMLAVELVKDQNTKEPDPEMTTHLFEVCRQYGVIASKSGPHRSVIRMVPPLCIGEADVETVITAMTHGLE